VLLLCVLVGGAWIHCGGATLAATKGSSVTGKASWYGGRFHGRKTASGERFDKRAMTAAHRELPFGTKVLVTSINTGRSVVVRINDRGPFGRRERIIDVSEAAAESLGMKNAGVVQVKLEVLSLPAGKR
jgi:rare lipoprotein A